MNNTNVFISFINRSINDSIQYDNRNELLECRRRHQRSLTLQVTFWLLSERKCSWSEKTYICVVNCRLMKTSLLLALENEFVGNKVQDCLFQKVECKKSKKKKKIDRQKLAHHIVFIVLLTSPRYRLHVRPSVRNIKTALLILVLTKLDIVFFYTYWD